LLHYAVLKGQTRLASMLLLRGAPADIVMDDGHTPLSDAINSSDFIVAHVILDNYRARGKLQEAFEQSLYDWRGLGC